MDSPVPRDLMWNLNRLLGYVRHSVRPAQNEGPILAQQGWWLGSSYECGYL